MATSEPPPGARVGIDLGGTKVLMVADSPAGRSLSRLASGASFGPADLEDAVRSFLQSLPAAPDAVGLSFPGLVAPDGRVVACDVLPRFVGWTAPPALRTPWRFAVLNDCEAALVAEARHHPEAATLAVVAAGTGIGAAVQVEGRPLRGANGWAGELGNVPLSASPVRTLDALASGQAILERAGCGFHALEARAAAGDGAALALIREAGAALGLGLAMVIHLVNPSALALGGGVLRLPGYRDAALAAARAHTLPPLFEACAIGALRDGEQAAAVGAALAASRATR